MELAFIPKMRAKEVIKVVTIFAYAKNTKKINLTFWMFIVYVSFDIETSSDLQIVLCIRSLIINHYIGLSYVEPQTIVKTISNILNNGAINNNCQIVITLKQCP
jgi:hypothetical protein